MSSKIMYSTESGDQRSDQKGQKKSGWSVSQGPVKIRIEKKGRAGKSVTVLFNLPFEKAEAKKHAKNLQKKLATGSSVKDGQIELQGDHVDSCIDYFSELNIKSHKAGG